MPATTKAADQISLSTAFTRPQTARYAGRGGASSRYTAANKSGSNVRDSMRLASARQSNNANFISSSREQVVNLNLSSQKNSLQGITSEADTVNQSVSSSTQFKKSTIQNRLAKKVSSVNRSKRPMTASQRVGGGVLQQARLLMQTSLDSSNAQIDNQTQQQNQQAMHNNFVVTTASN